MADMNLWDGAILVAAAYVAVMSLVRLMRARRDALVAEVRGEMLAQRPRAPADPGPRSAGGPAVRGGRGAER